MAPDSDPWSSLISKHITLLQEHVQILSDLHSNAADSADSSPAPSSSPDSSLVSSPEQKAAAGPPLKKPELAAMLQRAKAVLEQAELAAGKSHGKRKRTETLGASTREGVERGGKRGRPEMTADEILAKPVLIGRVQAPARRKLEKRPRESGLGLDGADEAAGMVLRKRKRDESVGEGRRAKRGRSEDVAAVEKARGRKRSRSSLGSEERGGKKRRVSGI
ncbi:hypothetical protein BP5796_00722 [Coleophoma crateriformis]|uniref:Uncharacterized protein n=1 Tax=Coleophoma crateriformis TaxID=565419 RepID=A0A3D8T8R2_9HELO|nr:hypothetical protein BP5796_00722 [Coleophoma crateriformis]